MANFLSATDWNQGHPSQPKRASLKHSFPTGWNTTVLELICLPFYKPLYTKGINKEKSL